MYWYVSHYCIAPRCYIFVLWICSVSIATPCYTMDTVIDINTCPICESRVLKYAKIIYCYSCCRNVHRNCTSLFNTDFELAKSNTSWYCRICNDNIFPLNLLDDDDFQMAVHETSQNSNLPLYLGNESKLFPPFEINEDENYILDYHGDLDPDKCYFNQYSYRLIKSCNYFVEDTFNKYLLKHNVSQNSFCIIHLNIRSMPANFTSFLSHLENITNFLSLAWQKHG